MYVMNGPLCCHGTRPDPIFEQSVISPFQWMPWRTLKTASYCISPKNNVQFSHLIYLFSFIASDKSIANWCLFHLTLMRCFKKRNECQKNKTKDWSLVQTGLVFKIKVLRAVEQNGKIALFPGSWKTATGFSQPPVHRVMDKTSARR